MGGPESTIVEKEKEKEKEEKEEEGGGGGRLERGG